jgi:hypothetical protein
MEFKDIVIINVCVRWQPEDKHKAWVSQVLRAVASMDSFLIGQEHLLVVISIVQMHFELFQAGKNALVLFKVFLLLTLCH